MDRKEELSKENIQYEFAESMKDLLLDLQKYYNFEIGQRYL